MARSLPRGQAALNHCEEILFPLAAFPGVQSDDCSGVSLTTEFRRRCNHFRQRSEREDPCLGGRNPLPGQMGGGTSSWGFQPPNFHHNTE